LPAKDNRCNLHTAIIALRAAHAAGTLTHAHPDQQ
jgi:hypothetical protein